MKKGLNVLLAGLLMSACGDGCVKKRYHGPLISESPALSYLATSCQFPYRLAAPAELAAPELAGKRKALDELINATDLTPEEFADLIHSVKTLADIERVLNVRDLYYPQKGTAEHGEALNLTYGAPWKTDGRRYGVCDELALYVVPFLLNISSVKDVSLVELVGDVQESEGIKKNAVHAFVIFQDEFQKWRYFSNGDFSKDAYATAGEANKIAAKETRYLLNGKERYKLRVISELGTWVYDDEESEKLRPHEEACLP